MEEGGTREEVPHATLLSQFWDLKTLAFRRSLQYVRGMEHYRRTAHTRFDIKFHLVWITKYRKKLLRGDVGLRLRQIVRTICAELEVEILKGHVSADHVHLFVSCPPHVSASYLMQRIKGKTSRKLLQQFSHLNKQCWGRHLWARGFFVASSGVVTDEAIIEYIRTQDVSRGDGERDMKKLAP